MSRIRKTPTVATIYGSQLIALVVNTFFFGIAFLMVLHYFKRRAKQDALYVKATVAMMIILATLQTIFVSHQAYRDLISHFGRSGLFGAIELSTPAKFICVYLTTFIAQMFFASRIWLLTKRVGRSARLALIPIILLALLQLISGSIQVHLQVISPTFADLGTRYFTNVRVTILQGCATAACDVAITVTLCWLYHAHSSVSSHVNSIFDRLMVYAINRAAATSVCALLTVFLYNLCSGTYYFIIPCLMTGQLYVISVVSVLTSREALREDLDDTLDRDKTGSATKFDMITDSISEKHSV